jgi:hypothetical protein
MELAHFGALAALALVDSTSFGTLLIPVWLLLAPGRLRPGRILLFLTTVAVFYFAAGLAILFGAGFVVENYGTFFESRGFSVLLLGAGIVLLAWSFQLEAKAKREKAGRVPAQMPTLADQPGASGSGADFPGRAGSVPNGVGSVPNIAGSVPGGVGSVPNIAGSVPGGVGSVPKGAGSVPGSDSGMQHGVSGVGPAAAGTAAGTLPSGRLARWRYRAVGSDSQSGGAAALVGLALAAATLELATMLPYLGAIGLISTADLVWPLPCVVLAAYCTLMIAPALVLLGARLTAARRVDPVLKKLDGFLSRTSTNTLSWVTGILGVVLVINTAGHVFSG